MADKKCVMVLDERLPAGLIANTAAILGITLGKAMPEAVGRDVYDRTNRGHMGIIEFPVPILRGSAEQLKSIRERLYGDGFSDVLTVDFSDLAQGCKTYDEFVRKMSATGGDELQYLGLALCGSRKQVNKLTGSLPLLR